MRVLFCTAPQAQAPQLVRQLVEEGLIGCGNVLPGVRSVYRWQGKIEDELEAVMLMETPIEKLEAAMERLVALHPYEVPKILAVCPTDVHTPYLAWLREATDSS